MEKFLKEVKQKYSVIENREVSFSEQAAIKRDKLLELKRIIKGLEDELMACQAELLLEMENARKGTFEDGTYFVRNPIIKQMPAMEAREISYIDFRYSN